MGIASESAAERAYILSHFSEAFRCWKGKRIALLPGRYMNDIIDRFDGEFHFARILERKCTDVPDDIDLLILTAYRDDTEQDYARICASCEKKNIPLLDPFGLDQTALHRELEAQDYLTISQWKELLLPYDVVSASVSWTVADYDDLQKRWVPRPRFMILYRWMLNEGKTVLFLPEEEEQVLSMEKEICGFREHVIERKEVDRGFLEVLARFPGKRILHVGLNTVRDGIVPREYGIDSRIIRYYSFTNEVSAAVTEGAFYADRERLIEEIDRHDIISFDLFDTLIKRTVLHPKDVLEITEERTGIRGFADNRYEIQTSCPHFTLDEIYRALQERCGYDDRTAETLRGIELFTETQVIIPRRSMTELFGYAKSKGKTVVLVSDMYLEESFLQKLLEKNGIRGYDRMYLSCHYKMLKHEGLFEEVLKQSDGKTVLHIGDNPYSDIAAAREFGLDVFYVPSCLELAKRNGCEKALALCETPAERKLLGLSVAEGFDDPFAQHGEKLIANMVVAPLAMSYLIWVCTELKKKHYDWFLLFSRDGKILQNAYDRMRARLTGLPPAKYLYVNRHAAFLTVMDDFELAKDFIRYTQWEDAPQKMLAQLCCLSGEELQPYRGESPQEYWQIHEAQIHAAAERFREQYRVYMDREGIIGTTCAAMDFVSEGNSQRMLERHISDSMDGYYVGVPVYVSRFAPNIRYWLDQDLMDYDTEMKIEVYFTSMEPALDHIGENGEPVFAEEIRGKDMLERIGRIHAMTEAYLARYQDTLYDERDTFGQEMIFELCRSVNNYEADNVYYDDMSGKRIGERNV